MNTHRPSPQRRARLQRRQRGVALVVALILLVVATLTGMAGIRSTTLQEKMTGNMYDRSLAMQSAEAALRAAERRIAADANVVTLGGINCRAVGANCPIVPANAFSPTDTTNWQNATGGFLVNAGLAGGTPQYFIQWIGVEDVVDQTGQDRSANRFQYGQPDPPVANVFRVTARSGVPTAENDRALVVLSGVIRVAL